MNKKSQTEILGLAIIVVIIIIGIVLSLRFMRPNQTQELKDAFTDSTLASNMLNVMLKTTLDCKDIELKNLLQDCAEGAQNKEYCGPEDRFPCEKAKAIISLLLNETLTKMNREYSFEAKIQRDVKITLPERPTCTESSVGTRYQTYKFQSYPLPTKRGTMEITLAICR